MTNYRNRIGEAIAFARNVAGRSQQELADMLGRDKRTIQKWERGEIRIALEDYLDVFDTLHLPVGPYEMWIRHPELFPRGMEDIKGFSTEKKRRTLADYYLHQAAPLEIEQEYYILFGDHGSNSCGIRQEQLANLQTPLRDRKRIVNQIIDNYYGGPGHRTSDRPGGPAASDAHSGSLLRCQCTERGSQREPVQHRQHRELSGRCGETGRRVNRTADGHVQPPAVFAFGCLRENIVKFADSCYTYPIDEKEG